MDDDPLTEQGFTGSPASLLLQPRCFLVKIIQGWLGERISAKSRFLSLWVSWKLNKHTAKPTGWTDPRVHQPWIDARLPETWTLGQACSLAIIPPDKYLWAILLEIGRWIFDRVHRYLQIFSCPLCTGQLDSRKSRSRRLVERLVQRVYIGFREGEFLSLHAREIVG